MTHTELCESVLFMPETVALDSAWSSPGVKRSNVDKSADRYSFMMHLRCVGQNYNKLAISKA